MSINKEIKIKLDKHGILNGVTLWHVICYDDNLSINTGLLDDVCVPNKKLNWNKNYKQAVHILDKNYAIDQANMENFNLNCILKFEPSLGKFNIDFKIKLE